MRLRWVSSFAPRSMALSRAFGFTRGQVTRARMWGTYGPAVGLLLASVTFTNETATGWQQANLATPVGSHCQHDICSIVLRARGTVRAERIVLYDSSGQAAIAGLADGEDGSMASIGTVPVAFPPRPSMRVTIGLMWCSVPTLRHPTPHHRPSARAATR